MKVVRTDRFPSPFHFLQSSKTLATLSELCDLCVSPSFVRMENQEKLLGMSLSSESARARSQKQQKEASRHAAPDARERILGAHPYRRRRSGSVLSFQGEFPYIELHVMLDSDANSPGWNAYASKGIADVSG